MTERSELRRVPARGSHDGEIIHAILDSAFLAHVGFQVNGQPFVVPTLYGRESDKLYLHGSVASRMLLALGSGVPACIAVTIIDGLVLARSAFHHSMNYRSVMAFGMARPLQTPESKVRALRIISEHLMADRWDHVRRPSDKELAATAVLEFVIEEASAKARHGPPIDDEDDYRLPVWAGVIPLRLEAEEPIADSRLAADVALPQYVLQYSNGVRGRTLEDKDGLVQRK
jgi:uncharacterized protein